MKNKEITIFELIKLIEERKAPYEITYKGTKYYLDDLENYYRTDGNTPLFESIFDTYNDYYALQEKVIISEENENWEDIDNISIQENRNVTYPKDSFIQSMFNHFYDLDLEVREKINKLISNQKYLKERLDSKDE